MSISGFTGFLIPLGDFGKSFNPGLQYGLTGRTKMPGIPAYLADYDIESEFVIGFVRYSGETSETLPKSEYTTIVLIGNAILNLNPTAKEMGSGGINPFVIVGVGYYLSRSIGQLKWTDWDGTTWTLDYDEPDPGVGINFGAGASYFINQNIFIDGIVKYHYILPEVDSISLFDIRIAIGGYF
ncbi:MAG: hypothetical protein IIB95_09330 [Candidatus Marinimicrobia bacterium]|nr:hypothetical protein [Candidatus Neomarinimicrobiota bacterium]